MVVQVSTRIDKETKLQFDKVCEGIGVSPSNALSIFIKGVVNYNGIPFSIAALPEKPTHILRDGGGIPYGSATKKMSREEVFGCMRGQFEMSDDFDAPLEDFKEYME